MPRLECQHFYCHYHAQPPSINTQFRCLFDRRLKQHTQLPCWSTVSSLSSPTDNRLHHIAQQQSLWFKHFNSTVYYLRIGQKFRIGTSFFPKYNDGINNIIRKKGIDGLFSDGKSMGLRQKRVLPSFAERKRQATFPETDTEVTIRNFPPELWYVLFVIVSSSK